MKRCENGVAYCEEARALLDGLAARIKDVVKFHEDQFAALVDGEGDTERFDDLIHLANLRKRRAKYAYIQHLEAHGCSTADVLKQNGTY